MTEDYVPRVNFISRMGAGVVGGVVGGLLLALALTALEFADDRNYVVSYGELVGDPTTSTSWVMLLVVGGAIGAVFGMFVGRFITGQIIPALGVGLVWGIVTWVVLALILLPLFDGTSVFNIGDAGGIFALAIYTAFGVTTAIVYALAGPRRRYHYRRNYNMVMALPGSRRRRRKSDPDVIE